MGECGGKRHPTSIMFHRTWLVVRRKAALLRAVDARTVAFREEHNRREEIVRSMVAGSLTESPCNLMGVLHFIAGHTHSPGNPEDANKSDFAAFASSFKLPFKHYLLQTLRDLSAEIGEWWAEETFRQAKAGAS